MAVAATDPVAVAAVAPASIADAWLFGWDPLPGIVSVWADRSGHARLWQRTADGLHCSEDRFRPWLFAASLDDVRHLGDGLAAASTANADQALACYQELDGPPGSLRYLLSACDGRTLQRAILHGAGRRLGRSIGSLRALSADYYSLGPVEQYLMASGRVYFRGLAYDDLHRLHVDLETTALSPAEGRIFLVAVRDSRGLETILETPRCHVQWPRRTGRWPRTRAGRPFSTPVGWRSTWSRPMSPRCIPPSSAPSASAHPATGWARSSRWWTG